MPLSGLNYSEFELFIYLCAAHADDEINLEEIEVLFEKMDLEHFGNSTTNELLIGVVFKIYKSLTHAERMQAIENAAQKHLLGNNRGLKILQNMHQIVKADGIIKPAEKELFEKIESIINQVNLHQPK